jgi:endonuclease III
MPTKKAAKPKLKKRVTRALPRTPISPTGAAARAIAATEPVAPKVKRGKTANPLAPERVAAILDGLEKAYPKAVCALLHRNAWELLVATILSAQSTDARVNMVTPALFKRYKDARALAKATSEELEPQIHSTGFYRAKARSLLGMAQALVKDHGGSVPASMDALVELPGVGRKTANVVLGHALGVPGLPVDRHVLRVSNRIGIAEGDDPVAVEQQLCDAMPRERWTRTSDTLILHGRRICRPRPLCDQCVVRDDCDYFRLVISRARDGKAPKKATLAKRPAAAKKTARTARGPKSVRTTRR